jgi:hypothetical protein
MSAIPPITLYCRRRGLIAVCLSLLAVAYVAIFLYAQHPRRGFSSQSENSFVQFQFFTLAISQHPSLHHSQMRWAMRLWKGLRRR